MTIPQISGATRLTDLPAHINDIADAVNGIGVGAASPFINVKAPPYSAAGDGVTDDTTAIQAAVDSAQAENANGRVYFPAGNYLISSTISLNGEGCHLEGSQGTDSSQVGGWRKSGVRIFGGFNDYLFSRTTGGIRQYTFSRIGFNNTHTTGKCVLINNTEAPSGFFHCWFRGHQGVIGGSSGGSGNFNTLVSNCTFSVGTGTHAGSIGLALGSHMHASAIDVNGFENGVQIGGSANYLIGARIEVCTNGLYLGLDPTGTSHEWGGLISGVSMEANDYGVYMLKGSGVLQAIGVLGSNNSPSGQSITGFHIRDRLNGTTLISCKTSGTHSSYMLDCPDLGTKGKTTIIGFSGGGTGTFNLPNLTNIQLINTNGTSDVVRLPVIATASLPAAGTQQDGRAIIEDAGAGDRNIILYAGGERFRIDGGSTF